MSIAETAVVAATARVPASCEIGPYCVIGPGVQIGENCRVESHTVIEGPTTIGANNHIFPFCTIGLAPQDLSYENEPTQLEIGDANIIREFASIHRGTVKGGGVTRIGNHNLVMAYTHIAHDCQIGNNAIMANAATLGGHVTVEDYATVGALCPVHQFVRIGRHSYIGGGTTITQDVLPFSKTSARRENAVFGANRLGLQRRGFSRERIDAIQRAFRTLLTSGLNTSQALERLKAAAMTEDVTYLVEFIQQSERGVIK